jgi:acyl carrier protein
MPVSLEVEQAVTQVVVRHFPKHRGPLEGATRFREDLGADSLDLLELLYVLEQELGIAIPDAAAAELATIGDVVRYLERTRR